ncbi:hypothetical protein ACFE04_030200 [Oxalis oulophora]
MDRLPPVLAFDIFQRVPIKSIGRSMCVSKYWLSLIRSLIRTPPFISSYTIESSKIPSNQLLISDESGNKISINRDSQGFESYKLLEVPFEPDDQESFMRGSCNGLLCIINRQGSLHFRLVDMSQLSFCFRKNGGLFLQVPWYHGYTQMYKKVIILLDPQIGEKKIIVKDSDVFCDEIFCFFESLVLLDHPSAQSY